MSDYEDKWSYDENDVHINPPSRVHLEDQVQEAEVRTSDIMEERFLNLRVVNAMIDDASITNAKIDRASVNRLIVVSGDIENAAIKTAHIDNAQIETAHIKLGAITTALIEKGAIGTVQIADGSITDAKIVELTANKITAGILNAGEIEVVNLNAASITVGKINGVQIENLAIGTGHVANNAISGDKISTDAVVARHIQAAVITGDKLVMNTITAREIASKTITANEIVTGTITAASGILADLAVTNAKIANTTITDAKIANLSATKLIAGTIDADVISLVSANSGVTINSSGIVARNANFLLEDTGGLTYAVQSATNVISDHSFELIKPLATSWSATFRDWGFIASDIWKTVGAPRLQAIWGTAPFGLQAAVVNSTNYVTQDIDVGDEAITGGWHTISAYFARTSRTAGTPRIRISCLTSTGALAASATSAFKVTATDGSFERQSLTFAVPTTTKTIRVHIETTGTGYVAVDGVQLVVGRVPVYYNAERSLWELAKGNYASKTTGSELVTRSSIATGRVTITPVAGVNTSLYVPFNNGGFKTVPNVVASLATTVPGSFNGSGIAVSGITVSGFTVWVNRINDTSTAIEWIAIGDV